MSVLVEKFSNNILKILINRPSKRNAINLETFKYLREAFNKFENDEQMHVAILSGTGGNFCAGYDLQDVVDKNSGLPKIDQLKQMLWPLGVRLSDKKIVIAAIDGHAAGFGYELALKCHFRIADRGARMGFMNRRFGIPILNGGTVILPQMIGLARASELVATGKAQLALEALQYGVLTYISDIGCSLGRSLMLAKCLTKFHQPALLHDLTLTQSIVNVKEKLEQERAIGMTYLQRCGPLEIASKFLDGELGRHGNYDLGNLSIEQPEVTL